jgi:hypothetical protein
MQRAFLIISDLAKKKKGGLGMFKKYSAMTMEDRDAIVEEWTHTVLHTTA